VRLFLEHEPVGIVEKVGARLNIVEKQAEGDLGRFKAFIESEGSRPPTLGGVGQPRSDRRNPRRGAR